MSRSRRRPATAAFSLFSMLDALLCVMGALILILAVISKATHDRIAPPPELAKATAEEIKQQEEELRLRIAQLAEQRERTQADLRARQLELGHLEDDAARLKAQIDEMASAAVKLQESAKLSAKERGELEFEVERKQGEIARKRLELEEERRRQAGRAPSFAIVPYVGPNGTHRPPIYIECGPRSIVIQPEGIELYQDDFDGPLGPGNPLAAAVRAAREQMAHNARSSEGETGEPYPLLLVRPEGIESYWAAREALQSWGNDFGYELIDAEWKLAYKPPDRELTEHMQMAVDAAREQQRMLARFAPRSLGGERVFRANPGGGGIVAERGSREERHHGHGGGHGYGGRRAYGGGRGPGIGGGGDYASAGGGSGRKPPRPEELFPEEHTLDGSVVEGTGTGEVAFGGDQQAGGGGPGGSAGGTGAGDGDSPDQRGGNGFGNGDGKGRLGASSGPQLADARGRAMGATEGEEGDGNRTARRDGGSRQGDGSGEGGGKLGIGGGGHPTGGRGQMASHGGHPSQASPGGSPFGSSPLDTPGQMTGRGASGAAGGAPGSPQINYNAPPVQHRSLAERRGKNWGLPEESRGASPVTRPVRLECREDAIFVMADDGSHLAEEIISFGSETVESVDPLIAAVWKHIEGWGIAGNGMYWHPVLVLDVQPGGDRRAQELEALLADSGIEVRQRGKQPTRTAANTGPTKR